MKKNKDYLTISSIIMIVYIVYFFLLSIKTNKFITDNILISILNVFEVVTCLIGSIYFIKLANSSDDLKNHKKGIMFFSIIFFLSNIVSGVINFKVYNNINDKVKKELPKLEDIKQNKYISLLSLIVCLFLLFYVNDKINNRYYNLVLYLVILFIMIFNYRKRLKRDFIAFKNNFKEYFLFSLKIWGISLITLAAINIIINLITGMKLATNQQNSNEAIKQYPIMISFLSMFYAPIAEELMFRGVFKEFFKKKYIFIFLSGFIFGLMHIIDDFTSIKELLFIFTYSTMGWYLAYLYYKTNNIFSNITYHFMQNSLATILMLIMTYLL